MNSLIAVSLWIALVTVIPGLITIASLFGAFVLIDPDYASILGVTSNDWIWSAVAVAIMILTQALGIVLEGVLVRREKLGGCEITDHLDRDRVDENRDLLDPETFPQKVINPYDEYKRLYFLLVRLEEQDDSRGHLERGVAQFFLTTNTLVSFGIGIVVTVGILYASISAQGFVPEVLVRGTLYLGVLIAAVLISRHVAIVRFHVLAKSVWSHRTKPSYADHRDRLSNGSR